MLILRTQASLGELQKGEDEAGIARSQRYLHDLIDAEAKDIGAERIVLGGFSQGGAMALYSGLTYGKKLGGIFGLSCYLLLQNSIRDKIAAAGGVNNSTPIFMGHGDADQVVQHQWGQKTAERLKEMGHDVDFRTYKDLPHSADPQEIDDLESFLNKVVPSKSGDSKAGPSS
jgi:predicted esterase